MTLPPRKPLRRASVNTGRSHRRKFADQKTKREVLDLCQRLGIIPPRVVWTREAQLLVKRLKENLTHRQQPSLLEELG